MGFGAYLFVVVMAVAVMASAVYALYWAVKTGQFREFEKGATEIFDDEEPQGRPTDFFPRRSSRSGLRPDTADTASPAGPSLVGPAADRPHGAAGQSAGAANRPDAPRFGGPFDGLRVPSPSREDASPDPGKPSA